MAQIPHCCGCGVGWQSQLQCDPLPGNFQCYGCGPKKKNSTKQANQHTKVRENNFKTEEIISLAYYIIIIFLAAPVEVPQARDQAHEALVTCATAAAIPDP